MKRFIVLVLIMASSFTSAQVIGKGGMQANAGLCFSSIGVPIYAGVEYGISEEMTLGGFLGFTSSEGYGYRLNWFGFGGILNYHLNHLLQLPDVVDVYGGATLYYERYSYSFHTIRDPYSSGPALTIQLGGRYFFTKNIAGNLELAAGTGNFMGAKIGATYTF